MWLILSYLTHNYSYNRQLKTAFLYLSIFEEEFVSNKIQNALLFRGPDFLIQV